MNEPALDLDVGHAAPNEWVLTSHEEQHLLTYWRRWRQPGLAWIEWLLAGPAAPFTFGGSNGVAILESACKEIGVPATIRLDQSSEVVSRYFELGLG